MLSVATRRLNVSLNLDFCDVSGHSPPDGEAFNMRALEDAAKALPKSKGK
jgi:hypothetical protein